MFKSYISFILVIFYFYYLHMKILIEMITCLIITLVLTVSISSLTRSKFLVIQLVPTSYFGIVMIFDWKETNFRLCFVRHVCVKCYLGAFISATFSSSWDIQLRFKCNYVTVLYPRDNDFSNSIYINVYVDTVVNNEFFLTKRLSKTINLKKSEFNILMRPLV